MRAPGSMNRAFFAVFTDFSASGAQRIGLGTIMLDACCAQTSQAVLVDGALPAEKFLDGKPIALARFFQRQKATAHRCDDFCLAADNPSFC